MSRRLLVVEDDAALRQMLGWELEELGYAVTAAGGCREALALVRRQCFDIALLDYGLPDGDGVGLLEALRREAPGMPVVMCSGLACPDVRERALRGGAIRFLAKPVAAALLHRIFQGALGD